jgi:hypothetical protein
MDEQINFPMKLLLFPFLLVLFYNSMAKSGDQPEYWEDMSTAQKNEILHQNNLNPNVLAFYNNQFEATDDDLTFNLIDTLVKGNNQFKPLYFWLFNKVLRQSDAALSEALGLYCYRLVKNDSVYVINYFTRERKSGNPADTSMLSLFASNIGEEFGFATDGTSEITEPYAAFKNWLKSLKEYKTSPDFKTSTDQFLKELEASKTDIETD